MLFVEIRRLFSIFDPRFREESTSPGFRNVLSVGSDGIVSRQLSLVSDIVFCGSPIHGVERSIHLAQRRCVNFEIETYTLASRND